MLWLLGLCQACFTQVDDCPPGLRACGRKCSDLQNDPANCGSCGVKCEPNFVCNAGQCRVPCEWPQDYDCGQGCTKFHSDPNNCGRCGNVCPSGSCFASECN